MSYCYWISNEVGRIIQIFSAPHLKKILHSLCRHEPANIAELCENAHTQVNMKNIKWNDKFHREREKVRTWNLKLILVDSVRESRARSPPSNPLFAERDIWAKWTSCRKFFESFMLCVSSWGDDIYFFDWKIFENYSNVQNSLAVRKSFLHIFTPHYSSHTTQRRTLKLMAKKRKKFVSKTLPLPRHHISLGRKATMWTHLRCGFNLRKFSRFSSYKNSAAAAELKEI